MTMQKKNKKWIGLGAGLAVALLAGSLLAIGFHRGTPPKGVFKAVTYLSDGGNLYYQKEVLEGRKQQEDPEFDRHMQVVVTYLMQNYPGQCFALQRINYGTLSDEIYFHINQIVGDAIVQDTGLCVLVKNDAVLEAFGSASGSMFHIHDREPVQEDRLIAPALLEEIVTERAKEYYKEEPVGGEYRLEMTQEDRFVYCVQINSYSKITLDAYTGEILDVYFWDGICDD